MRQETRGVHGAAWIHAQGWAGAGTALNPEPMCFSSCHQSWPCAGTGCCIPCTRGFSLAETLPIWHFSFISLSIPSLYFLAFCYKLTFINDQGRCLKYQLQAKAGVSSTNSRPVRCGTQYRRSAHTHKSGTPVTACCKSKPGFHFFGEIAMIKTVPTLTGCWENCVE